jgi:hypothetical protein
MKIIQTIDRILWATRVASITSPPFLLPGPNGGEAPSQGTDSRDGTCA